MKTYYIDENYIARTHTVDMDDHGNEDRYQNEVYLKAKELAKINNFAKIMDIGTGSGFKLIKYFDEYNTLGLDLPQIIEKNKKIYPEREWSSAFKPVVGYDLIIASDVIEHLLDPDDLLDLIEQSKPKLFVLSTPDRSLMRESGKKGPPKNIHHVREWTKDEFEQYIGSRFNIIEHYISNHKDKTQLIIGKCK